MNVLNVFKALSDPVRLDVVRHLAKQRIAVPCDQVVGSCSQALELSQPTMSYHLSKLVSAGIVGEQKVGKHKMYQLNAEALRGIGIDASKI